VDTNPEAVKEFVNEHGLAASENFDDLISDTAVDALILATPHALHEEQIAKAAGAGKHVFCEKPLGLTKASAERSVAACNDAGVMLGVGHERRFEPALQEIKPMVAEGELGTIMQAEANFSHDILADMPKGDWRTTSENAPAAGMTAMGIHLSDAYVWMFGPAVEVYAQTAHRVATQENGDIVMAQIRFKSGALGYLNATMVTPFFMRFQVFGSEAWVEARDSAHPEHGGVTTLTICKKGGTPENRTMEASNTVLENLECFADAIAGNGTYINSQAEMIDNIALLEAVTKSVAIGEVITL
ncbi:MAG TPA: gfo/Idh/MocA family oxidoreductase, partial [Rhodospirillaceae bacterium]|nr:gfo/Idh/MocA family oxidoreductase [Rhodospirillaceae bacterium]